MPYDPDEKAISRSYRLTTAPDAENGDPITQSQLDRVADDVASGVNAGFKDLWGLTVYQWVPETGAFPTLRPNGDPIKKGDVWNVNGLGSVDQRSFKTGDRLVSIKDGGGVDYDGNWVKYSENGGVYSRRLPFRFEGLGNDTPYQLPAAPGDDGWVDVYFSGVLQPEGTSWGVDGDTIYPIDTWPRPTFTGKQNIMGYVVTPIRVTDADAWVQETKINADRAEEAREAAEIAAEEAQEAAGKYDLVETRVMGDGVTRTFTLNQTVTTASQVLIHYGGGYQFTSEYTVSGNQITFNEAPPAVPISIRAFVRVSLAGMSAASVTTASGGTVQQYLDLMVTPFPNRAAAQAATIPPWVTTIMVRAGSLTAGYRVLQYVRDTGTGVAALTTAEGTRWSPANEITPFHFGAAGTGVDDIIPLEAFRDYAQRVMPLAGKVFDMSGGIWGFSRKLNFKRSVAASKRHVWLLEGTEFLALFSPDADNIRAVVWGDETGATSWGNFSVKGRWIVSCSQSNSPIMACFAFCGQIKVEGMNSGAGLSNTVVEFLQSQNNEFTDYKLFAGGHTFGYRDFSSSRFRRTGNVINRVSGTTEFRASDVGKKASMPTGGGAILLTITGVTSPTSATVDIAANDSVDQEIGFGSPSPMVTAGSATFTIDGDEPVTSALLWKRVGIPRAAEGNQVWWGLVVAVDPETRSITLDNPAAQSLDPVTNPLTDSEDVAGVQYFVDSAVANQVQGTSQHRSINGQHEWFRGVAQGYNDAEHVHNMMVKCHAIQTGQTWLLNSVGAIWGNTLGGSYYGEFDARYRGRRRVYVADQTQALHFPYLATRMQQGEILVECGGMRNQYETAKVSFGAVHVLDLPQGLPFSGIVVDRNPVFEGYSPPEHFNKMDRDDDWWYKGTKHWWRGSGAFSMGNGALVYDPTTSRLEMFTATRFRNSDGSKAFTYDPATGNALFFGQAVTVTLQDADATGTIQIELRNVSGTQIGQVRFSSATGDLALRVNGVDRVTATARGVRFSAPVFADNAAAITGGLVAGDAYKPAPAGPFMEVV